MILGLNTILLVISKYVFQWKYNVTRQTVHGLALSKFVFDLIGGLFGLGLILVKFFDMDDENETSLIRWPKLLIIAFSCFFDVLMIIQHRVTYRSNSEYFKFGSENLPNYSTAVNL